MEYAESSQESQHSQNIPVEETAVEEVDHTRIGTEETHKKERRKKQKKTSLLQIAADSTTKLSKINEDSMKKQQAKLAKARFEQRRAKMIRTLRKDKQFVKIGYELIRWDKIRRQLGIHEDEEFAKVLLDVFVKYCRVVNVVAGPSLRSGRHSNLEEANDLTSQEACGDMSSSVDPENEHTKFVERMHDEAEEDPDEDDDL